MKRNLFILVLISLLYFNFEYIFATESVNNVNNSHEVLPNFTQLVKLVGNSVVNITSDLPLPNQNLQSGVPNNIDPNDPLYQFFKRLLPGQSPQDKEHQQLARAFGSGFIISSDGYIVTNAHVVNKANKIIVKTTDKQELEAKLIGVDIKTDVALIKVVGKNLVPAKIGDSNKLEIGEWVAAIGAPFGFINSVTHGIVSAKNRNLEADSYTPFLQTDVPVNPGNSGGPLFNLQGEVVGINSQIYSRDGGYMGLSFSIPINFAMTIVNQLKAVGSVKHGLLGVQIQELTTDLAKAFSLNVLNGSIVAMINPGSAADKAGIKIGDIITKVNDKNVDEFNTLPYLIGMKKPGDKVSITLIRNKQTLVVSVVLSNLDDNDNNDSSMSKSSKPESSLKLDKFGIELINMSESDKKRLNVKSGVIIKSVFGIAEPIGLLPGDLVLSINNSQVNNVNQVKQIIGANKTIALLVSRSSSQMYVTLTIE